MLICSRRTVRFFSGISVRASSPGSLTKQNIEQTVNYAPFIAALKKHAHYIAKELLIIHAMDEKNNLLST